MQRRGRSGDGVMCAATLGNLGGLTCTRPEHPERPKDHVFEASWAADRVEREAGGSDE